MTTYQTVRRSLRVVSADGAEAALELVSPLGVPVREALLFLPALGVGVNPNLRFATAMASTGIATAVMEWRGIGSSNQRAGRKCDWNYRHILDLDIPAALAAAERTIPDVRWSIGGHSIGGQFSLMFAGQRPDPFQRVVLIGSGHPYWRGFERAWLLRGFATTLPAITTLAGHFPGTRLGFAGREARGLMRDWALTARRGNYRIPHLGDRLHESMQRFDGTVCAVAFAHDWLAPPASLANLKRLVPNANWSETTLAHDAFQKAKADHFGWLKEPDPVVRALDLISSQPHP
ncbi:alpha/beta fold hydrolase [Xanthomonadaceae bacterium JHOS43]|nr:alpha/beta fold hydrolase [Xanthomonadaceae bacterium JHOS43]